MKYSSKLIIVLLSLFFSLFDINGQQKQEVDTIGDAAKRIDLLIKERLLQERSSLQI